MIRFAPPVSPIRTRGKVEEFVEESRLVVREFRQPDGKVRLEMEIEGDGLDQDPDEEVKTGFAVAATMFQMWNDGTVLARMRELMGFAPSNVEISLESLNGVKPGHA